MLRPSAGLPCRSGPVNSTLGCMSEPTAGDLHRLRAELEVQIASALGRIILRMSRLDTNLGLMVASINRLQGKTASDASLSEKSLHARLRVVRKFIGQSPELGPTARQAMTNWWKEVDAARSWRNQLIHGRWDIDPQRRVLLDLTGLGEVHERGAYTMEDLDAFVATLERLNQDLNRMRREWRLP